MQKRMWLCTLLSVFVSLCWGMDGRGPVKRFLQYDPTPPPPMPYPVLLNPTVTEPSLSDRLRVPVPLSSCAEEDDLELSGFSDVDEVIAKWFDSMSTSSLYLVRYDFARLRYLTFCECSRRKLIGKYLAYLLSDSTTAEYTSIRSLSAKMAVESIKQEGSLYTLLCRVKQCGYVESQLSVEELTVNIVLHDMIEHQADSEWYQQIDQRIKESFEEALAVLKDESE